MKMIKTKQIRRIHDQRRVLPPHAPTPDAAAITTTMKVDVRAGKKPREQAALGILVGPGVRGGVGSTVVVAFCIVLLLLLLESGTGCRVGCGMGAVTGAGVVGTKVSSVT
jgi:hypothetical protein